VVLDAAPEGVGAAARVAPDLDVGDTSVPDAPGAAAAIVLSLVMVTAIPDWLVHAAVSTVSAAHTAVTVRRERLFTPSPRRILHRLSAGAFRLRCCSRVLLPSGRCRPSQMLGVDRFKWRSAPGGQRLLPGTASALRPVDLLQATVGFVTSHSNAAELMRDTGAVNLEPASASRAVVRGVQVATPAGAA